MKKSGFIDRSGSSRGGDMGTVGNGGVSVLAGLRDLGFLSASAARARSCSSIDSVRVTSSCDMAEVG